MKRLLSIAALLMMATGAALMVGAYRRVDTALITDGAVTAAKIAAGAPHVVLVVAASGASTKALATADYVCDGTQDEDELNAAVTAAHDAGGGIVFLPVGDYTIVDRIVLKSNVRLIGESNSKTRLLFANHTDTNTSHPVITNSDRTAPYTDTDIAVENIYIDGNKGTASGDNGTDPSDDGQDGWDVAVSDRGCIDFLGVTGVTVRNCRILDPWTTGIELQKCTDVTVEGNHITNAADDSIGINDTCSQVRVIGNTSITPGNVRYSGGPSGIEVQGECSHCIVENNIVLSVGGDKDTCGITVAAGAGENPCHDVTISGNTIDSWVGIAIGVDSAEDPDYTIVISGNTYSRTVPDGKSAKFLVLTKGRNITVTGNTVQFNPQATVSGVTGICIAPNRAVTGLVIQGNTLEVTANIGNDLAIYVNNDLADVLIVDNVVTGTADGWDSGVYLSASRTYTDLVIAGNRLEAGWPVRIIASPTACVRCVLRDNYFNPYNEATCVFPVDGSELLGWEVHGNFNLPALYENAFVVALNTSGVTLLPGEVVIYRIQGATEVECDTTAVAGDSMVMGVVAGPMMASGAYDNYRARVQTRGRMAAVKVNGTTDVDPGDLLCTHTDVKIAQVAASGDVAFAISMGTYHDNDSSGTVPAFLILPRQVK